MQIKELKLKNFRNYSSDKILVEPNITVLEGKNAMGKTNILEAIALLSTTKSPRASKDEQLIQNEHQTAHLSCDYSEHNKVKNLSVVIDKSSGRIKKLWRLQKVPKRPSDVVGTILSVLFKPDDLNLLTTSPGERRSYLDLILSRVNPGYLKDLSRLKAILRQRQAALELLRENNNPAIEVLNTQLCELGAKISFTRLSLLKDLEPIFLTSLKNISKTTTGKLKLINNCLEDSTPQTELEFKQAYLQKINELKNIEIKAARNLVGPQREDLEIYLNNNLLKDFGSRGEWRTGVLALKRSEMIYLKNKTGRQPILLLDDVTSELDDERQNTLVNWVEEQQTILTTINIEQLPIEIRKKATIYKIENGKILSAKNNYALT